MRFYWLIAVFDCLFDFQLFLLCNNMRAIRSTLSIRANEVRLATRRSTRRFSSNFDDSKSTSKKSFNIKIDRSGLLGQVSPNKLLIDNEKLRTLVDGAKSAGLNKKSRENELVKLLRTMIEVRGPVSVAEFIRQVGKSKDMSYV